MLWIDYLLLIIIAISCAIGLIRGFLRETLSLSVWLATFWIAANFYQKLAGYLTVFANPLARDAAAIIALMTTTLVIGALTIKLLMAILSHSGLSTTDRLLGFCFGFLRSMLVICGILICLERFLLLSNQEIWCQSYLIPKFHLLANLVICHLQVLWQ